MPEKIEKQVADWAYVVSGLIEAFKKVRKAALEIGIKENGLSEVIVIMAEAAPLLDLIATCMRYPEWAQAILLKANYKHADDGSIWLHLIPMEVCDARND